MAGKEHHKFPFKLVLLVTLLASLILFQYIRLSRQARNSNFRDFKIYRKNAMLLIYGRNPYKKTFDYPPSSFTFFLPLNMVSMRTGRTIFKDITIASLILTVFFLLFPFKVHYIFQLAMMLFFMISFPVIHTLRLGQVNLFVLFLISLTFFFHFKKKKYLAGLCFGLAAGIKPLVIPVGIFFLLLGDFLSLISGASVFVILNLIVMHIGGFSLRYFRAILPGMFVYTSKNPEIYNQSLRAFMTRINFYDFSLILSMIITAILAAAATIKYLRLRKNKTVPYHELKFFSQILLLPIIGNSFAHTHHYVFAIPLALTMFLIFHEKRNYVMLMFLSAALLLFSLNPVWVGNFTFANAVLSNNTLFGALILFFLSLVYY